MKTLFSFFTLLLSVSAVTAQLTVWPQGTNTPVVPSSLSTNAVGVANSIWGISGGLVAEGTDDTFETTFNFLDATADTTINVPAAPASTQYSLFLSDLITNAPEAPNSVWATNNGFKGEGSAADTSEVTVNFGTPTADYTTSFPALGAGVYVISMAVGSNTGPQLANGAWFSVNGMSFEGATANTEETIFTVTDPTADRSIVIPDAPGTVQLLSVQTEAATDTLTVDELYGGVINNTGAAGAAVYNLPAPVVGMHFRVYLTVAEDVDINPADGTQILGLTNATGDAISSAATVGNSIELVAISSTEWGVFAINGAWADAN